MNGKVVKALNTKAKGLEVAMRKTLRTSFMRTAGSDPYWRKLQARDSIKMTETLTG